ncbi:inosine 5'-monophosphate dehydrogenase [Legionella birminghamensis]|uniref:GMP reductase n=1 Tax=Legionella birminghamensis TaxID=28083 RepID=A0A378I597_9GAMM|nr:guanosine monophosphate reductase [Legionella birminghamensis]KTC70224.1 inosine 5'-monophosphate dehydrogenase [Legionella birminghamensis]STX30368.1 GMP reductase [Legionella birminghamensis]
MHTQAITFDDVLLVPAYNHHESRRVVDISMKDRLGKLHLQLPVISSNMDTITESKMANFMTSKGGIGALHRFLSIEENIEEFKKCSGTVFVSVGCSDAELQRAEALRDAGADYFCVDVAHGHAKYVGKMLKELRKILGSRCIMAGNVATYAGADYLASCGADIIKAGVGGGSVCSTRIKTGFGIPMITCIQDCARTDRSIVADGGIRTSGDIVKALAFGADFVMIGGMLAGTEPTPGEVITKEDGRKVKRYRGMASREAQEDFHGQMNEWKTAEGVAAEVPYRDTHDATIADIIGGLRSGLTYAGADSISELQRKLDYVVVTQAGRLESLPHKLMEH